MLDQKSCTGCTACYAVCPVNAINMVDDQYGTKYPCIDVARCVHCGLCETCCPVIQIERNEYNKAEKLSVLAVQSKDDHVREESSSGGIFSALAKKVLDENGVVIGCAMSADFFGAHHIMIETEEELKNLRGSKYIESDLEDVIQQTIKILRTGRRVLFSGTPCQVAGLHYALRGWKCDNLLTMDFICHGVPIRFAWRKYLCFQTKKIGKEVKNVFFRNKKNGWKIYSLKILFSDGTEYIGKVTDDLFLRGFINNLYLRSGCYHCRMKGDAYFSDITVADFWGVDSHCKELSDDKGTSLAIIHSRAGMDMMYGCKNEVRYREIELDVALAHNPSYYSPVAHNALRGRILRELDKKSFDVVFNRYYDPKITSKVRRYLLTMIYRLGEKKCPHSKTRP